MGEKYTVEIKELKGSDGDSYIEFPPEIFNNLDWKEGDDLKFIPRQDGSFTIKKVKYETIELELDDEELFKYMQVAHEQGVTFNQLIENSLAEQLIKLDFESECG